MYLLYSLSLMPAASSCGQFMVPMDGHHNRYFFPREPAGTCRRRVAETIPDSAEALFQLPAPAGSDARTPQAPTVAPLHAWPRGDIQPPPSGTVRAPRPRNCHRSHPLHLEMVERLTEWFSGVDA